MISRRAHSGRGTVDASEIAGILLAPNYCSTHLFLLEYVLYAYVYMYSFVHVKVGVYAYVFCAYEGICIMYMH